MRDLIATENITLDGVIDAAEGWFEPGDGGDEIDLTEITPFTPGIVLQRYRAT